MPVMVGGLAEAISGPHMGAVLNDTPQSRPLIHSACEVYHSGNYANLRGLGTVIWVTFSIRMNDQPHV